MSSIPDHSSFADRSVARSSYTSLADILTEHLQVCQFFSKTSRDTRLQYKIELFLAGMQDGPSSDLSSSERLRMLNAHQKAWRGLEWTEKDHLDLRGDTWEFYGGVLGVSEGCSFSFKQMSSKLRGIPGGQSVAFG